MPFNSQEANCLFFGKEKEKKTKTPNKKKAGLGFCCCCGVTPQPGAAAPLDPLLDPALPRGLAPRRDTQPGLPPLREGTPGTPPCTPDRDMGWGHQCDTEPPPPSSLSAAAARGAARAAAAGPGWEGDARLDGLHSSTQRSSDLSHH